MSTVIEFNEEKKIIKINDLVVAFELSEHKTNVTLTEMCDGYYDAILLKPDLRNLIDLLENLYRDLVEPVVIEGIKIENNTINAMSIDDTVVIAVSHSKTNGMLNKYFKVLKVYLDEEGYVRADIIGEPYEVEIDGVIYTHDDLRKPYIRLSKKGIITVNKGAY